MRTIDIGTVLEKFDNTYDEADQSVAWYGIRFITATGEAREMAFCRKNVKNPKANAKPTARGKFKFNLKARGAMMLHTAQGETRTPKVACFYGFKDHGSNTWLDIRH